MLEQVYFRECGLWHVRERAMLEKNYHSSVYRYDIETQKFTVEPSLNQPRYLASSCALNNKIYVIAGSYGKIKLSSIELLSTSRKKSKWRILILPALTPCNSPLFSVLNESQLLIAGGEGNSDILVLEVSTFNVTKVTNLGTDQCFSCFARAVMIKPGVVITVANENVLCFRQAHKNLKVLHEFGSITFNESHDIV